MPTPEQMAEGVERRTGRPLEEWLELVPDGTFAQRVEWLVAEHGLKPSDARMVLQVGAYMTRPPDEDMVAAQYAGAKEGLRPVYDAVVAAVSRLGDDVKVSPRKTYVSFDRARQFALVQASTRTRVDLGLRLDDHTATSRLAAAGAFGSGNITHRVALSEPSEVDGELRGWLRAAYEGAA